MLSKYIAISLFIVVIAALRTTLRRWVSPRVINALWGFLVLCIVPGLLFVINLFTEMRFSIFDMIGYVAAYISPSSDRANTFVAGDAVRYDITSLSLPLWFCIVWVIGSVSLFLIISIFNEKMRRNLYNTRCRISVTGVHHPVYIAENIASPCVFSVRHEVGIYITKSIVEDQKSLRYVLLHETNHIHHHDLLWTKARLFVLVLFWVNPLVWLAVIWSKNDSEIACDDRAVATLSPEERCEYSRLLVNMVNVSTRQLPKSLLSDATTMVENKHLLKRRITQILNGRKYIIPAVCAVLSVAFILFLCIGNQINLSGMTPEEVIQQYIYYEYKEDETGMARLRYNQDQEYFLGSIVHNYYIDVPKNSGESISLKELTTDADGTSLPEADRLTYKMAQQFAGTKCYELSTGEKKQSLFLIKRSLDSDWELYWYNGENSGWEPQPGSLNPISK